MNLEHLKAGDEVVVICGGSVQMGKVSRVTSSFLYLEGSTTAYHRETGMPRRNGSYLLTPEVWQERVLIESYTKQLRDYGLKINEDMPAKKIIQVFERLRDLIQGVEADNQNLAEG